MARSRGAGSRPTIRRMLETTPARVAAPNARSAVDEPIPDEDLGWAPLDLPRAIRSGRTYRIPVILIALAAAVGAYFAAQYALRVPQAHAVGQREAYSEILETALDAVPDLQAAAAAVTDGAAEDGFGSHLATLVRLEGLAAQLQSAADRSALLVIPGLPTQDLEMLGPIRDRMDAIADQITAINAVITDVAVYRSALDGMFLVPDLPGPSEGPSVGVFSDRLSQMTAATVGSAALLPDGDRFAAHRAQVEELVAWLPDWQAAYLEALRDDDLARAESLRNVAADRIETVRSGLTGPLEDAAAWTTSAISRLRSDIQAALVLAG